MREILFRGKSTSTHQWVEGNLTCAWEINGEQYGRIDCCLDRPSELVLGETIGQYTGYVDKHGNRIFEGDILEAHFDEDSPNDYTRKYVEWRDGAWILSEKLPNGRESNDWLGEAYEVDTWEIIGNIYDNPEMIGG